MPPKIAVIKDTIPHPHHGGSGVTVYSIIRELLARGMDVSVLALFNSEHASSYTQEDLIGQFAKIGVPVQVLAKENRPKGRRRWPTFRDQFPSLSQRGAVTRWLKDTSFDAVVAYHWDAISATHGYQNKPRLGVVGDPVHLPALFRNRWNAQNIQTKLSWSKRLRGWLVGERNVQAQINGMARLLTDCSVSGAFAAHHAKELRSVGAKNCRYYRTPVMDPLVSGLRAIKHSKFKIMLIGHLRGIVTLAGVDLVANEILPVLIKRLGPEKFEIHIVGGYYNDLPASIREKLNHSCVKIRGHISPPHEEFLSSHIVLVPTPIELGIRVRIITAFSYGTCVVAHQANQMGIPELKDGDNCMLGKSGEELAAKCCQLHGDKDLLKRLENGARSLYETSFSQAAAGGEIINSINNIIKRG